ncbi:MAG: penicillin-binding protein 1A [Alphaproteobacteria bacterium]|nr:penicillin-binding protein 1A [Alphaproteobacteria bacterium]
MRFLAWLFSLAALLLVVGLVAGFAAYTYVSRDLPDYSKLKDYQPPVLSRIYAGDGRPMAVVAAEQRLFVPISAIPKRVIDAFLAAEDKDFYRHSGIDLASIAAAALTNLQHIGSNRRPIGASTITQQVAKNFLLGNELSLMRKFREAILALRIDQALSKDRILELYLNQIFLGQRSHGVATAALNYFNKTLSELTIDEAAYLAALPKAPNNYHPVKHRDAALARRNWVIGRMLEDGAIQPAEAEVARAAPLDMKPRPEEETVVADYFAEEVRREMVQRFGEKNLLEGGFAVRTSLDPMLQAVAQKTLREGLIDFDKRQRGWRGPVARFENFDDWKTRLQKISRPAGMPHDWHLALVLRVNAQNVDIGFANGGGGIIPWSDMRWARKELAGNKFGPPVAKPADVLALGDVVMVKALPDAEKSASETLPAPKTGTDKKKNAPPSFSLMQIPVIQGALVALDPHTGRVLALQGGFSTELSQFNRATQAQRQPGSAFKPFIYLAALEHGLTPASLVLDAPFAYNPGPNQPLWQPENYSEEFYGPTTLRVGLEKSRNVMTVRLAHFLGMPVVADYARKFNINDHMPEFLAASLGSIETTPLRLTAAYAMLVNGGREISPTLIDRVQDRTGKTVWAQSPFLCQQCLTTDIANVPTLVDTREHIADERAAYQTVSMLEGVAQRGTAARLASLGKPVAGKTGTTNDAKDAWFVGFSPDLAVGVFVGFDEPKPLGSRETGASVAVPIFEDFMRAALADKPGTPFRVPPGLRMVRIDAATGQEATAATEKAIWEAFVPGTEPGTGVQAILDGSSDMAGVEIGPAPELEGAGTGGLY